MEEVVVMPDPSRLPAATMDHWDWQRLATCRGSDIDVFFHPDGERNPARGRRVERALQVCATCPVVAACRDWAHRVREPYGVWGGECEDERRFLLARERRQQRPDRPAA